MRQKALDAAGPILIKRGYDWVDLEEVATKASLNAEELASEFTSKALLCEAWLEQTDEKARKHHEELLSSDRPPREILETYFRELQEFMEKFRFAGCPYTNTARALRGRAEPGIELRIRQHKTEVRRFFQRLCQHASFQADLVAEALFLIYSGATTESANIKSMEPVKAGRQAALTLFDLHQAA